MSSNHTHNLIEIGLDTLLIAGHRLPGAHLGHVEVGNAFATI
ncbi:hypothetical protein [Aeromonas popoffii]|nr:hypothetical protein [Aeromonas popoffii]